MRTPIALAFTYPNRIENSMENLDFFGAGANLTFENQIWRHLSV